GEESPGSMETRCRLTAGGGDPRESATESKPPRFSVARVKGWGKSPPRDWQQERHGKPHREQDRIGAVEGQPSGLFPAHRPGRLHEADGDIGPRRMAATFSVPQGAEGHTEPGLQAGWQFCFEPGLSCRRRG